MLAGQGVGLAFESAKVLPVGVRNIDLRYVTTKIDSTTTSNGDKVGLGDPLNAELKLSDVVSGRDAYQKLKLQAFMLDQGFASDDVLGRYTADVNGRLDVIAPVFAYGLTDKVTLAIGIPYYQGATSLAIGWQPTNRAQEFVNTLARPDVNQLAASVEARTELNNAVDQLASRFRSNGYSALSDWRDQGFGDLTIGAKYRFYENDQVAVASTGGVVAPTGQADDPNNLTDIGFGDDQWDIFAGVSVDEPVMSDIVLNQNAKYTVQLPGERDLRQATENEPLAVANQPTKFKLGDKVELGTSAQYLPAFGLVSGLGYSFTRKFADVYKPTSDAVEQELEKDTEQVSQAALARLGYSTLPAFERGDMAVPIEVTLTYSRQLSSRNLPVTDLAQFDLNLYF